MPSPTSTIEVDEIVRSGNLYKEGVSRLKWNTRYFELLKHRIVYYDHEGSDTVRGEATLEGATIQSTKAARPGKFAFRLNLPAADTQHKKFILSADSLDETKAWITALKGCGVESSFEDESTARRSSIAESFSGLWGESRRSSVSIRNSKVGSSIPVPPADGGDPFAESSSAAAPEDSSSAVLDEESAARRKAEEAAAAVMRKAEEIGRRPMAPLRKNSSACSALSTRMRPR